MRSKTAYACVLVSLVISAMFILNLNSGTERKPDLSLTLVPNYLDFDLDKPFCLTLFNQTNSSIELPLDVAADNCFHVSFRFVNQKTKQVYYVYESEKSRRRPYDRLSETLKIAPWETHSLSLCFDAWVNGKRSWVGLPDPNSSDKYQVTAYLSVSSSKKTTSKKTNTVFWKDSICSEPVTSCLTSPISNRPQPCILRGYEKLAIALLKESPREIGRQQSQWDMPLHLAVAHNRYEVAKWLLKNEAPVNAMSTEGRTALHLATEPEMVELLVQHGANWNVPERRERGFSNFGATALDTAAKNCSVHHLYKDCPWPAIVNVYVENGADIGLNAAIRINDLARVAKLLDDSPELADQRIDSSWGMTPLRLAVRLGHFEICRYLIENCSVDVDANKHGYSKPLVVDVLRYPELVALFEKNGATIHGPIDEGAVMYSGRGPRLGREATLLHHAAMNGDRGTIEFLLNRNADMFATDQGTFPDKRPQTPMEVAIRCNKLENLMAFLDHPEFTQADDGLRAEVLNNCLIAAAKFTGASIQEALVRDLIWQGADAGFSDGKATAVQYIANRLRMNGEKEDELSKQTIRKIVGWGGTIDPFSAVAMNDEPLVKQLIEDDPAAMNACSPDGCPALTFAVGRDNVRMSKLLIDAGCELDPRFGHGDETPLMVAVNRQAREIACLLCRAGADVNAVDRGGITALHEAIDGREDVWLARLLLNNGARWYIEDERGNRPFHEQIQSNWPNRQMFELYDEISRYAILVMAKFATPQ